jgi:hypothetical protein
MSDYSGRSCRDPEWGAKNDEDSLHIRAVLNYRFYRSAARATAIFLKPDMPQLHLTAASGLVMQSAGEDSR